MGRVFKSAAAVTGLLVYIWVAAVLRAPVIRARKAARRAVRLS